MTVRDATLADELEFEKLPPDVQEIARVVLVAEVRSEVEDSIGTAESEVQKRLDALCEEAGNLTDAVAKLLDATDEDEVVYQRRQVDAAIQAVTTLLGEYA